jgi:hypothetical protein
MICQCYSCFENHRYSGTDEHALIDISANRSNDQRQQINMQYKSMYGQVSLVQ